MPRSTNDRVVPTKTDLARIDAARQIEELVNSGDTDVLVEFITEEQREQLASDWREGKE